MRRGPLLGGKAVDEGTWARVNRAAVAKAISELSYEEALAPVASDAARQRYELALPGDVAYRFEAVSRIWGQLAIRPDSLMRCEGSVVAPVRDAVQFMLDAREALGIAPDTLCTYARELYSTLMADCRLAAAADAVPSAQLAAEPDVVVQAHLDGHPKAPANKGRIGWGLSDAEAYAPEFRQPMQLVWVAAAREALRLSLGDVSEEALIAGAMDGADSARLEAAMAEAGVGRETHVPMPVHPWQWDYMIAAQFAGEIAARRLVPLGAFGDPFLPQQALRTLANAARPEAPHIKLPLTILNTSAWRGVPGKYMAIGPALSAWLEARTKTDPVLAPVTVLREIAGLFYPHPIYQAVPDAPYQFREMLGCIFRESPEARVGPGRRAMMLGALTRRDRAGVPLVSALIAGSGLRHEAWLGRLFAAVVVPLYHFMARYGVGFIAHGQNVTLVLEGMLPVGVAVKDFQGDLDLIDEDFPELDDLPEGVRSTLGRRPAAHLIHHLQTGHFASVLRFVSDAVAEHDGLQELDFYHVLAAELRRYQATQPELAARFEKLDLFGPKMARIAINKVRFAIGYGDSRQRPVPTLGSALDNPLFLAERAAARTPAAAAGELR